MPTRLICSEPSCGEETARDAAATSCAACGGLLEFSYDPALLRPGELVADFRARRASGSALDRSGVWRFRELLPDFDGQAVVTLGEGGTPMPEAVRTAEWAGVAKLAIKHQGANPTGSFKDLGMTVCISEAVRLGRSVVACASTGNTSSSMAAYSARAGLQAVVFVPRGSVSRAKLAQAEDFGALVMEVGGNFDEAFALLRRAAPELDLYLVNSINPLRLEGQKTLLFEIMEQRGWRAPDVIAMPGGNLGNCSAVGKGLRELFALGLLDRMPALAVIQAEGASPFHRMWRNGDTDLLPLADPETRATAIRIGSPANWRRARRVLEMTDGMTAAVSEEEILRAKRQLASEGIGCEPASAAAIAGVRQLRASGQISSGADVVAVLTGHQLKDTDYILESVVPGDEPQPSVREDVRERLARWLE
ncbi:MAG: threonine synthase [Candidatus Dormibacteraeota bacterium]|nr:threonine synthase [Candidatus Dormibacteraeota bacterium]